MSHSYKALKEKRPEGKVKQIKRRWDSEKGRIVNVKGEDGKVIYQETDKRTVDDVWRISMLQPADRTENAGFPTQKPTAILQRIIEATTEPGDLVADFFCGSGTTMIVAEDLGRRWIGCDLSRWGTHISRKRLLDIEGCRPFEVLNLGYYERQYWQGTAFGDDGRGEVTEQAHNEYLAFILKLYGAEPISGSSYLHGKKGAAMVHVGAVDAPVTIDEISRSLDECQITGQGELHVLGWEWEMGVAGPNNERCRGGVMQQTAKERGIKLLLLQIPREVMEEQAIASNDVKFFELAYLEAEVRTEGLQAVVELEDFAIPNTELIDNEVREKIGKWSDFIDYWAIDWDFANDTFMQGWVDYRTRKDRRLELVSDPHTYEEAGTHTVAVKAIDIFGNDTTQLYEVEVG